MRPEPANIPRWSSKFAILPRAYAGGSGSILPPERNPTSHDDDKIDLAEKRLHHRERLAQGTRWHEITVANCGQCCIAEEEEIARRSLRQLLYKESPAA